MPLNAKDSAQLTNFLQRIFFDPSEAEIAAQTEDEKHEAKFQNACKMLNLLFYIYIGEENLSKKEAKVGSRKTRESLQQNIKELEGEIKNTRFKILERIRVEKETKLPIAEEMKGQIKQQTEEEINEQHTEDRKKLQYTRNFLGMINSSPLEIEDDNTEKTRGAVQYFVNLMDQENNKPANEQKDLSVINKIISTQRSFNCLLKLFDDFAQCLNNSEHFLRLDLKNLIDYIEHHAMLTKHSIFSVPEEFRKWDYEGTLKILSALHRLRASLQTIVDGKSPTKDAFFSLFADVSNSVLANELKAEIQDKETKKALPGAEQKPLYLTKNDIKEFILKSPLSIGNMRDYDDPEDYSLFWGTIGFLSGRELRLTHIPDPGKWTIKSVEAFWKDLEDSIRVSEYLDKRDIDNVWQYLRDIKKFAERTDLSPREKATRNALKGRIAKALPEEITLIRDSYFNPAITPKLLDIYDALKSLAEILGAKVPKHKESTSPLSKIVEAIKRNTSKEDKAQSASEPQKDADTGESSSMAAKLGKGIKKLGGAAKNKATRSAAMLRKAASVSDLSDLTATVWPGSRAGTNNGHDSLGKETSSTDIDNAVSQDGVGEDKTPSKEVNIGVF
ncbi:hypothetical protein RLOatenuis_6900 [Rickettsiales bacterium]|nr:hypothetical protein RLOatenuis_6900 [Rickettsiales bacterium]